MLERLGQSLPNGYEIFHHVDWQAVHEGRDHHGEFDVVVMAPNGNLLLIEVKAGDVLLRKGELYKLYASGERDVGRQCRIQYAGMVNRLKEAGQHPYLSNCLVLPDYTLDQTPLIAFSHERIIDARTYAQLGALVMGFLAAGKGNGKTDVEALRHFLNNVFRVTADLTVLREQIQTTTRRLSDGLATWGSRITSPSGMIRIQATAGSGKTQLALRLMEEATHAGLSVLYVCFNRMLADHVRRLAPTRALVANFHELAVDHYRRHHQEPDFSAEGIFGTVEQAYLSDSASFEPRHDLLIIDEGQDFGPAWVECLMAQLKPDGRLYFFEDDDQRLYERIAFDLDEAVILTCRDNFRSPQAICEAINGFSLSSSAIISRGPYVGNFPGFHVYDNETGMTKQTLTAIEAIRKEGYGLGDIVVLSGHGRNKSSLLHSDSLGPYATRRFTGKYTADGEPVWTKGELLVESVYRFKGQSVAAVVMTEIDFAELTPLERRKLFVGMTRAQMRLEMVISRQAETCFARMLEG